MIRSSPTALLGAHVSNRSNQDPRIREVNVSRFGNTEIKNLHLTTSSDEQVGRLYVAVHNAGRVRLCQPLRCLHGVSEC